MSKFCVMPFIHINIKHEGKLSPCWRYPDRIGDYTSMSLVESYNSLELRNLRKQLLNNENPIGCRSCWDMEDSNVKSTRQNCNETYSYVDKTLVLEKLSDTFEMPVDMISTIEVRFDNICNLMCRHCSPDYSSVWEIGVKKDNDLRDLMTKYQTFRKSEKHVKLTDAVINEITDKLAPNLQQILIAGGEPLYHDKHYKFLEKLLPHADHIELNYNSNFSTLEYKGKDILQLWKKFKKVVVRVSIDADKDIYEYIRVNGNREIMENNIVNAQKLKNIDISATCTTSLLNISRLPSIVKYFTDLNVYFHTSIVQYPKALNPKLMPDLMKDLITNKWHDFLEEYPSWLETHSFTLDKNKQLDRVRRFGNTVIKYMNSADWSEHLDLFVDYIRVQDKFHKTDFLQIYPEFNAYFTNT